LALPSSSVVETLAASSLSSPPYSSSPPSPCCCALRAGQTLEIRMRGGSLLVVVEGDPDALERAILRSSSSGRRRSGGREAGVVEEGGRSGRFGSDGGEEVVNAGVFHPSQSRLSRAEQAALSVPAPAPAPAAVEEEDGRKEVDRDDSAVMVVRRSSTRVQTLEWQLRSSKRLGRPPPRSPDPRPPTEPTHRSLADARDPDARRLAPRRRVVVVVAAVLFVPPISLLLCIEGGIVGGGRGTEDLPPDLLLPVLRTLVRRLNQLIEVWQTLEIRMRGGRRRRTLRPPHLLAVVH
jgi:hypothetical protein